MDRTSDFVKITVLFDNGQSKPQPYKPLSIDARRGQQIADQLRQQELFLRDLQDLVSKKSIIGDDPTSQIASLTDLLKKELAGIEKNIQVFQQSIDAQRGRNHGHYQAHFTVVTQSLKSRCAKNAKQFHVALQQHTATIRERSTRRSKFSHGGASPMVQINAPLFARTAAPAVPQSSGSLFRQPSATDPSRAPLLDAQRQPNDGYANPHSIPNGFPVAPALTPMGLRRRQGAPLGASAFMQPQKSTTPGGGYGANQQLMQQQIPRNESKTRYQNAQNVESTIVEITGMYTRMADMVVQQGEIISRIDDDMDVAQANVEASHSELLKLFSMVSGNRSLIIKIFIVLILMIFLFVVIF